MTYTVDGYVFICPHRNRLRFFCLCGDRRALMCLRCNAVDHPALDVVACGRCGVNIEFESGIVYTPTLGLAVHVMSQGVAVHVTSGGGPYLFGGGSTGRMPDFDSADPGSIPGPRAMAKTCYLCSVGFPTFSRFGRLYHYPTQRLGMIPVRLCKRN